MGYRKVLLRGDQELSLSAFIQQVQEALDCEAVMEEAPVGEPQTNSAAERVVQTIKGLCRTVRAGLEANVQGPIAPDSLLMA